MRRVLLVVVAAVAALLVVPGGSALACSCVGLTPAASVAVADVVLRGTVTAVAPPSRLASSTAPTVYTVRVARVFKGAAAATTFVQSEVSGAACGLEGLEPGREYVLFATQEGDGLWASLCGGSGPAERDLVAGAEQVAGDGWPARAGTPARAAPATQDPYPSEGPVARLPGERDPAAGDTAWLVPLVGGSVLALLLGAALVLVLLRGRSRGRGPRRGPTPPRGPDG